MPPRSLPALACLCALLAPAPARAFDPVPYAPPKVGLEVHFEIRNLQDGKVMGTAVQKVTQVDGKEVTFSSKSEQMAGGRKFKFDDVVLSQYGLAPRRVITGQSAAVAVADWKALDALWPLAPGKAASLNFEVSRTSLRDIGKPGTPMMRGKTTYKVLRAEEILVLGEHHPAILIERETADEIVMSKTPIKRVQRYLIWWSLKLHWVVRMQISGSTNGQRHGSFALATKVVAP